MTRLHNPQDLVLKLERDLVEIAKGIAQELMRPSDARRKLPRLISQFDKVRLELRTRLLRYERTGRGDRIAEAGENRGDLEERRLFKRLRLQMQMLRHLSATLDLICMAEPQPLYQVLPPKHNADATQLRMLDAAFLSLHRLITPYAQSTEALELGCFPDIPLGTAKFMSHAHAAYRVALAQKRPFPLRFLDVGCGGGVKVLIASGLFDEAMGFDFNPAYVQSATESFVKMGARRCSAFWGNALEYEAYADFDILYFYKPMSDDAALMKMEKRMIEMARPGTLLIAPYQEFTSRHDGLFCHRIEDAIFVTGGTAAQAQQLQLEASRMGPDVFTPDRNLSNAQAGWARDLWMACARNGYLPD
jgi:protein-L-isoaspartate O-methyltransferase